MAIRSSAWLVAIQVVAFIAVLVVGLKLNCAGRIHGLVGGLYSGNEIRGYGWPFVFLDVASEYDWKGITQIFPTEIRLWQRDATFHISRFYAMRIIADTVYWLVIATGAFLFVRRALRIFHCPMNFQHILRDLIILAAAIALIAAFHCSGFCDAWKDPNIYWF
jgi:hypothetical protein